MARRGFFAEIQHQIKVAEREADRREKAAIREHQAAVRRTEQAKRAEERARALSEKAAAAERKALDKELKLAHQAAMIAHVEQLNLELTNNYEDIDSILATTLDVDDYVDLEGLKQSPVHPPIPHPNLIEPQFHPPAPTGGLLFKKRRQDAALAQAKLEHKERLAAWEVAKQENERHHQECLAREAETEKHNKRVDALIANLGYGVPEAVNEYISIVLSNSVYPDCFPVAHEFEFQPSNAELDLVVKVPAPGEVPSIKAYKYVKASDQVSTSELTKKAVKDRYTEAIRQTALRSLHEIFEADRRGLIRTISLQVGAEATDPATGILNFIPFVAVAAERDTFMAFNLAGVVPEATLKHMGAALSKDPVALVPADVSGIRKS